MVAHNVRWLRTERKIYSRKYQYAGTLDGLATVDSCQDVACCGRIYQDELSLIDWKSSNHLRTEYLYQTAAYQQAEQEEFGCDIKARWILRLGKEDGKFEAWYEQNFEQDFEAFLGCLNLYRANKAVEKRMSDAKKLRTFKKREEVKRTKPPKFKKRKVEII
jgi:translation initiation factor 2B subunit (eIF-2B alpha/beta/delta family)